MTNFERWQLFMRDIESPDLFIKWGFINLIASALQRRVWYYPDEDTDLPGSMSLFLNMFVALVGPPATGKGRVIKQVVAAIKHPEMVTVDPTGHQSYLINHSPDKVTCERLIEAIADGTKPLEYTIEKGGKQLKRVSGHCSCSFNIEELEVLFSKNSQDMVSVLNQCYDAGDLSYETKQHGKFAIKNICVNMLSGTTPESIKSLLTEKVIKTGFTSRVVAVYAPEPRFYRTFPGVSVEQRVAFNELVTHVKKLATKVIGEIKLSPEADEYLKSIYDSGKMMKERPNRDPKLDYYYGRKRVHWLKLAGIFHFADNADSRIIPLKPVQDAYQFLNATETNMHEAFRSSGRNVLWECGQSILRFIEERKEVRYKSLWFRFAQELQEQEFVDTLNYLLGTDQLFNINQQTSELTRGIFTMKKEQPNEPAGTNTKAPFEP